MRKAKRDIGRLEELARFIRHHVMKMTTKAGSGHPTSALSSTDLMAGLMFGGTFRYFVHDPGHPNNDRLIFSKGHASPLFYCLWAAAGGISTDDLMNYRKFGSELEGHPTNRFKYVEAPTGSLGQGLSVGVGMALNAKYLDRLPYRTYVLLGDSEMAEGSQWESIQLALHHKLDNLVGIIDVNRLGQRGETMYGHDLSAYERRVSAFGWEPIVIDGHSMPEIVDAYERAMAVEERPVMIIARTVKGKGVSFLEDRNGWHGKAISEEDLRKALDEIGPVDQGIGGDVSEPEDLRPKRRQGETVPALPSYQAGGPVATRTAYGNAMKRIYESFPDMVVLDAEVSNSTRSDIFKDAHPARFFEMFIAEQNMVGAALGLERRGKIPFVSTFAAFMTRAFDQLRMAQYAHPNIKFCGSHAGVSIGEDGPSQMGLQDLAMFRTLEDCVVLYPCDAVSTERLVEEAARHEGMVFIRTTRGKTPVIYSGDEEFPIGKCKVLRESANDQATVVAAGITLHEALGAYEELKRDGIMVRVIDLYSVKPLDHAVLHEAANATRLVITVEDHYEEGGMGEAVRTTLREAPAPVYSLAVRKTPMSGKPGELMDYEEISSAAIVREIKEILDKTAVSRQTT